MRKRYLHTRAQRGMRFVDVSDVEPVSHPSQFIIFATFVALIHHGVDRRLRFNVGVQESTGRQTEE